MSKVRVLIAEDSSIFAAVLEDIFAHEPDLDLIGIVDDGEKALELCLRERPDVVLMDVQMPKLDGLAATEQIMARSPTPILIITSDPWRGGVDMSFKALDAGALDLFPKTALRPGDTKSRREFLRKVRLLAEIPVIRHVRGRKLATPVAVSVTNASRAHAPTRARFSALPLLGLVASTGGPKALAQILGELPSDLPAALLIVQHITHGFTEHLARWLDQNSNLVVQEATPGIEPAPGHAYIAPSGHHLTIDKRGRLALEHSAAVSGHIPSGDVLLSSMARHMWRRSLGVILSGMGSDGARGMLELARAGCPTFAQDRQSSVVWGMPRAALELEAVSEIVELSELATCLQRYALSMTRSAR